jgi:hypothetical protein
MRMKYEIIYHIFHIKKVENEKRSQFKNINEIKQRLVRLLALVYSLRQNIGIVMRK